MNYLSRLLLLISLAPAVCVNAQPVHHSVAREWNEALLHSIRKDFARPTVHARNLWHTSVAMYDAWAAYTPAAENYLLGNTIANYNCPFDGVLITKNIKESQEEAISYAAYRLLKSRFQHSPNPEETNSYLDSLFLVLGYDSNMVSTDYSTGDPAALGNYIAQELINFGLQDSSNEQGLYQNQYYLPVNPPLVMAQSGNPEIEDPNRWQPLTLDVYIDQSGNIIPGGTASCLSPEWGEVVPFSLNQNDLTTYFRDGHAYKVYHDPGPPPYLDTIGGGPESDLFKKAFTMVVKWSSHLDTADGVMWDISPGSIGNIPWYPSTMDSLFYFYDYENGGDNSLGHSINPITGQPYTPQLVHRADYTRVLAEFWADGPDSETPPGHWFTLLNYVTDHPQHDSRWMGDGPLRDNLEWDVKSYFTLGGTMHDAAISSWGIKGWYDYVRPVSAFRYMADQGQSSDPALPNYSINGLELEPGFIEMVDSADAIAGALYQNVGKVKVRTWMGPDFVLDPAVDQAGVDWILAENWWSFQRPSFVAPPFPGYVSGHSTYSRAAAEIMEKMTGSAYFPGGMGEFVAKKNEFLFFEEGPSEDITLQWATYRDASDQCSLSRIWGGIHPPVDDMPGRFIGEAISEEAFILANSYWEDDTTDLVSVDANLEYVSSSHTGDGAFSIICTYDRQMDTIVSPIVSFPNENPLLVSLSVNNELTGWQDEYTYVAYYNVVDEGEVLFDIDVEVSGGMDLSGFMPDGVTMLDEFNIDMGEPNVVSVSPSQDTIKRDQAGLAGFTLTVSFDEEMYRWSQPNIELSQEANSSLTLNTNQSRWSNGQTFVASYDVSPETWKWDDVEVSVTSAYDLAGNVHPEYSEQAVFNINIFPPLGLDDFEGDQTLIVYPNPVKLGSRLIINTNNSDFEIIKIYDLNGQLVMFQQIENQDHVEVETMNLGQGEFVVSLQSPNGQRSAKVIVIR